jgi:hypothetical protein
MQAGNRHAAIVVKPNDHPTAMGMNVGVVRAGDVVTMAAAGDNGERLERACLQIGPQIRNHNTCKAVVDLAHSCKTGEARCAFGKSSRDARKTRLAALESVWFFGDVPRPALADSLQPGLQICRAYGSIESVAKSVERAFDTPNRTQNMLCRNLFKYKLRVRHCPPSPQPSPPGEGVTSSVVS